MRRGVYFAGKNLGRVADSEDEDEDLQADDVTVPEEFLAADAEVNVAAPDHGESETGCDLGDVVAAPEIIEAARTMLKNQLTEMENEMSCKDKIIEELRSVLLQLKKK